MLDQKKFLLISFLLLLAAPSFAKEFITVKEILKSAGSRNKTNQLKSKSKPIKTIQEEITFTANPLKSPGKKVNALREIDIQTKIVKEEPVVNAKPKNKIEVVLSNQLGENIRVRFDSSRSFYLKPYETVYLGWLDLKNYSASVYDALGQFAGVIDYEIAKNEVGRKINFVINRFLLTRSFDNLDEEGKKEILSKPPEINVDSANTAEQNIDDGAAYLKRKIKIVNISDQEIRVLIVKGEQSLVDMSWTIGKEIYSPQYLLLKGEPIEVSPETEFSLETDEQLIVLAKDLKIDAEGSYIWVIE